jgi:nitroimidazol reductase NimA-like FMN-containing flavoprotein (pyridoxamine 5'-phosphate oxidase superfamily)
MRKRGHYDRGTIFRILDSGLLCHVAFVFDNYPVVMPTLYWREGDRLYWHGSVASRMLRAVEGAPVCIAVTHFDGLVLARSAFNHSANYRSVTLFGNAVPVTDATEKLTRLKFMVDSILPERWDLLRPVNGSELKATRLMWIPIDEASAKVRQGPPNDREDFDWPVWAGVIPLSTRVGAPECDNEGESRSHPVPRAARPR